MTFKHKLKFVLAVLKGNVNKVTEVEKPVFIKADFKETMNLQSYLFNRKKYLEELEGDEDLAERDKEYQQLEEIERMVKTLRQSSG